MQKSKQIFTKGLFLTLAFLVVGVGVVEKVNANDECSITITSPNGGEVLELNNAHLITWTQTNIDKVSLYVCYGLYSSPCEIIVSSLETSGSTGSYDWNIPADFSERVDYKIDVVAWQTGVGTSSDKSDEVFTIGDSTTSTGSTISTDYNIQLLSQTTDEVWEVGKSYVIQWSNSNPEYIKEMNVSLATVDGTKWFTFSSVDSIEGQTDYSMTVVAPTMDESDYKIKLRGEKAYDGYLTETVSSDGFINLSSSIPAPVSFITVTSPNGGEKWEAGKTYTITWQSSGYDYVNISFGGCYGPMRYNVSSLPNGGSYSFTVSKYLLAQNKCKVTVCDSRTAIASCIESVDCDSSDDYFSIATCFPDNTLLKLPNDPKIYVIRNCERHWIRTAEEFKEQGYKWENVKISTFDVLNSLPEVFVPSQEIKEGAIIRVRGGIDIYIVKYIGNKKFIRLILNPSVFNSYGHLKWEDVIEVEKETIDSFVISNLVRNAETGEIYRLTANGDNGTRRHFKSISVMQRLGYDLDAVYEINETDKNSYKQGEDLK